MPKYVVSSTLDNPLWNNTTVLKGDVPEEVGALKGKHDGDVVLHGSGRLAQTLIENDLVDEMRLMVFPVVLGTGKRLFAATTDKRSASSSSKRERWARASPSLSSGRTSGPPPPTPDISRRSSNCSRSAYSDFAVDACGSRRPQLRPVSD